MASVAKKKKKKERNGQPQLGSPACAPGVRRGLPGTGSAPSKTLAGRERAAGPGEAEGGLGAARGFFVFFLFYGCNCSKRSRSGALPPSPGPPGNLRHSHRFPHVTWGRLQRPNGSLPHSFPAQLPAAGRSAWPPEPGNPGAGEGRAKGWGWGSAGRLRSWGCLRQQGPGRGGKGGGGPAQQQTRRPAAGAARRSGGCCGSPPVRFSLALRWEAGQREARRSLARAGGRLQLPIRGEARARLAPPAGCALYQG